MIKFLSSFLEDRSAEDHIHRAFIAGITCWILSLIALIWIPEIWIDLVILTVCLYGLYKKNKWAATALFVFYTGGKIFVMIETGRFSGFISLIFIYLFYKGMIAAFQIDPGEIVESSPQAAYIPGQCPKCKAMDNNRVRCFKCGASLVQS